MAKNALLDHNFQFFQMTNPIFAKMASNDLKCIFRPDFSFLSNNPSPPPFPLFCQIPKKWFFYNEVLLQDIVYLTQNKKWPSVSTELDLEAGNLVNCLYLQGGTYKDEDAIQLYEEDGWTTVAHMNVPRYGHAVSVVNSDHVICSPASSIICGCKEIPIFCIMWIILLRDI